MSRRCRCTRWYYDDRSVLDPTGCPDHDDLLADPPDLYDGWGERDLEMRADGAAADDWARREW